jgi:hypothetical protein
MRESVAVVDPAELAAELATEIDPADFQRLLGMPVARPLVGLLAERADWARAWYRRNGRPYLKARHHPIAELRASEVRLADGPTIPSPALAEHLRRWEAHTVVGIAASAGPEVDRAAEQCWREDRPDEGFFLERFGVAVVERLLHTASLRLCRTAEEDNATLTPHLSPGCGAWELAHQHLLWGLIFPSGELGPIRLLESGGLHPKCSILAAAGLTPRQVAASPLDPCRSCDLARCRFRRAPYRRAS